MAKKKQGWLEPRWPEAGDQKGPRYQKKESFVLRTYVVGGVGNAEVTYWLMGKGGASFSQGAVNTKCR